MILVEMYSKDDCHLCDVAKDAVLKIQKDYAFEFRQFKLQEHDERFEEFKECFPVIFINSDYFCQYRVREKDFIAKIKQLHDSR